MIVIPLLFSGKALTHDNQIQKREQIITIKLSLFSYDFYKYPETGMCKNINVKGGLMQQFNREMWLNLGKGSWGQF